LRKSLALARAKGHDLDVVRFVLRFEARLGTGLPEAGCETPKAEDPTAAKSASLPGTSRRGCFTDSALAWGSLGVTIITLGFTLRPIHVSSLISSVLIATGIIAVLAGWPRAARRTRAHRRGMDTTSRSWSLTVHHEES
jgi:hypothetical protein